MATAKPIQWEYDFGHNRVKFHKLVSSMMYITSFVKGEYSQKGHNSNFVLARAWKWGAVFKPKLDKIMKYIVLYGFRYVLY